MKNLSRPVATADKLSPVTFRIPGPGCADPFFGCKRTFWKQQVLPNAQNNFKPPIRSILIKQPGAKRGIRLILFESARAFFDALASKEVSA